MVSIAWNKTCTCTVLAACVDKSRPFPIRRFPLMRAARRASQGGGGPLFPPFIPSGFPAPPSAIFPSPKLYSRRPRTSHVPLPRYSQSKPPVDDSAREPSSSLPATHVAHEISFSSIRPERQLCQRPVALSCLALPRQTHTIRPSSIASCRIVSHRIAAPRPPSPPPRGPPSYSRRGAAPGPRSRERTFSALGLGLVGHRRLDIGGGLLRITPACYPHSCHCYLTGHCPQAAGRCPLPAVCCLLSTVAVTVAAR